MVVFGPLLTKGYWLFAGLGALYAVFVGILTIPAVQKNVLYLHRVKLTPFVDIAKPEQFGFARGQATPFYLTTPDHESLFAWHILPMGVYADNRAELIKQEAGVVPEITQTLPIQLLQKDPDARLIVFLHGNAGNVAQGWRPDAYRNFLTASDQHAHILTFDYRGFGRSTGTPSEAGLILDATTALRFAINTLHLPPSRIVIVGHSLGTAVTLGVVEQFAREEDVTFGGVLLIAAFQNLKSLVLTYSIGGVVPVLGPLRPYPFVQTWLQKSIVEAWDSGARLKSLVEHAPRLKLTLLHAINDMDISWTQSGGLFREAANAVMNATADADSVFKPLTVKEVDNLKKTEELGAEGSKHVWTENVPEKGWQIEQRVLHWGAHNQVLTSCVVGLEIRRFFGL